MSVRLWVLSDLHLETESYHPPLDIPDADVCVVAGDVMNKGVHKSLHYLAAEVGRWMPVVFVAGNHEFYRASIVEARETARKANLPGVHFLDDDVAFIGGVRFVGATLWTDFELDGGKDLNMMSSHNAMNDYRAIAWRKDPWQRLYPRHLEQMHWQSRRFLDDALRMAHAGPTVVVTHHAPSPLSVHPRYQGDSLNASFASNLTEMIEHHEPELWVHGHMHDSSDYEIGGTRVLCNPKGYRTENPGFDPGLVVEVERKPGMRP